MKSFGASSVMIDSLRNHGPATSRGPIKSFHSSSPAWNPHKGVLVEDPPFEKLMAANRGEIATRIVRGAAELGIKTVGIYAHEGKKRRIHYWHLHLH